MDFEEYKRFHENHMVNNTGSTILETGILLTCLPFGVFISVWCIHFFHKILHPVLEFLILVLPIMCGVTIMSDTVYILPFHMLLISIGIVFKSVSTANIKQALKKNIRKEKGFITDYRASTNMVSVLCILAVDFSIFPKKFAKTETFGYGLMDLGVGFYICSNGLVVRHLENTKNFSNLIKNVSILFILGFIRLILTKSINYHEHVEEYGTHWNFFFTLAFCKLLAYLFVSSSNCTNALYLSIFTGIVHEIFLNCCLQDWVFSDTERNDFLNANREGLSSSLGYVSLYFAAVSLGKLISGKKNEKTYGNLLTNLGITCIALWFLTLLCQHFLGVSRRLANVGYILWIISLTVSMIIQFAVAEVAVDVIKVDKKKQYLEVQYVPKLFEAINFNGLVFFLIGNLLTGLINFIFQTLLLNPVHSIILITVYMIIMCSISYLLYEKKIKLKF